MTAQQLFQHPLNQAALQRLRREHLSLRHGRVMPLLHLFSLGLEDHEGQPLQEGDPLSLALEDYSRGVPLQESAMYRLEDLFSPRQVLKEPLAHLSRAGAECLASAGPLED